jgi:hypothetical protein
MVTFDEYVDFARQCAIQARVASSRDVAKELWDMAKEYREKAPKLGGGELPDIGPPPSAS